MKSGIKNNKDDGWRWSREEQQLLFKPLSAAVPVFLRGITKQGLREVQLMIKGGVTKKGTGKDFERVGLDFRILLS